MVNSTANETAAYLTPEISYTVMSFLAIGCHGMIIIACFYHRMYQKRDIVLFWGMSMADFIFGFAMALAGCMRSRMIYLEISQKAVSRWYCASQPFTPFFVFGAIVQPLVLLFMSFDRWLAVQYFMLYRKLSNRFKYIGLGSCYAFSFVYLTVWMSCSFVYGNNKDRDLVVAYCGVQSSQPVTLVALFRGAWNTFTIVLSALANLCLLFALRTRLNQVTSINQENYRRNIGYAKTTLFLLINATVCTGIPGIVVSYITFVPPNMTQIPSDVVNILFALRSQIDFVIFIRKHKIIRQALISFVRCKRLTLTSDDAGNAMIVNVRPCRTVVVSPKENKAKA